MDKQAFRPAQKEDAISLMHEFVRALRLSGATLDRGYIIIYEFSDIIIPENFKGRISRVL